MPCHDQLLNIQAEQSCFRKGNIMLNKRNQRNHARHHASLILALVALTSSASGQVTPLGAGTWSSNGPDGGAIDWFVVASNNPNTVYAGRPGGVFKSTDGGATWASANSEMPNTNVSQLAFDPIHPATMYVLGNGRFNSNDFLYPNRRNLE